MFDEEPTATESMQLGDRAALEKKIMRLQADFAALARARADEIANYYMYELAPLKAAMNRAHNIAWFAAGLALASLMTALVVVATR